MARAGPGTRSQSRPEHDFFAMGHTLRRESFKKAGEPMSGFVGLVDETYLKVRGQWMHLYHTLCPVGMNNEFNYRWGRRPDPHFPVSTSSNRTTGA